MRDRGRSDEAGMALILALLALMILTFLGLTLAATTSTELQIATNYRWSQQAFYNAEAGIEVGKKVLATADWSVVLPPARTTHWDGATNPAAAADGSTNPTNRNYENWQCDQRSNGAGYGRVLSDGSITYANLGSAYGQNVAGNFTLWVRRPVIIVTDTTANSGLYTDETDDDNLILTAEGVAPYGGAGLGTLTGQRNRAVRTMEIRVSRNLTTQTCGTRGGQVGGGAEGANFGGCTPVDPASLQGALGLAGAPTEATGVR